MDDDNTPLIEEMVGPNPPGGLVGLTATALAGGWREVERYEDRIVFAKGEDRAEMRRGPGGEWSWVTRY